MRGSLGGSNKGGKDMDHGPKVVVVAPRPVPLATPLIFPYEVVPARHLKKLYAVRVEFILSGSRVENERNAQRRVTEVLRGRLERDEPVLAGVGGWARVVCCVSQKGRIAGIRRWS